MTMSMAKATLAETTAANIKDKTVGLCPTPHELLKKFNQNFYQNAINIAFFGNPFATF